MTVYECIAAVSAEIAETGIAKTRRNQQQGYEFRGIDDVYNVLAPLISKHGLVILPRILSRAVTERPSKGGGILFNVIVEAEFDFVSASDGTKHTARTFGEAMDSADKATNKAMSAAYKYVALQTFCIPTEGDNDADAHTPEVAPPTQPAKPKQAGYPPIPKPLPPPPKPPPPPTPPQQRSIDAGKGQTLLISEAQGKRFYAIAKNAGWADDELSDWLKANYGYAHSREIPRRQYDEIVKAVQGDG